MEAAFTFSDGERIDFSDGEAIVLAESATVLVSRMSPAVMSPAVLFVFILNPLLAVCGGSTVWQSGVCYLRQPRSLDVCAAN